MNLFKKTVGTQCLGQVDAQCPNFVNKTLLPAHKRYDECGSQVREIITPNYVVILTLVGLIVAALGGGGGYTYYRVHKAALDTANQIRKTVQGGVKQATTPEDIQHAPKQPEQPANQATLMTVSRKVDDALLTISFKNGMSYAANHMYENALKEFAAVEAKDPNYPNLRMNMGAAYMQLKQYDKARGYLETAKQQDSRNANVLFNLACLSALTGKTDEGLQELRGAVDLGFRDVAALRTDPDLASLRRKSEFAAVVKAASQK